MPTKLRATGYREVGGGMAANAACAIARLGGRVAFWGRAGDDAAGATMAQELAAYGVDARAFRRLAGCRSSQSAILVDAKGQRLIVSHHGDVPDDAAWLPLADVRWPAGARALFGAAREAGVPRVLDADVAEGAVIGELLQLADHVVFSEHGLACWASLPERTGERQRLAALERAWHAMRAQAPSKACAVTCGEAGSWWLTNDGPLHVPAPEIDAVDTLGAGDVFHGAYALAIAQGRDIAAAARFATLAAAIKCTRSGGRAGSPTRSEVAAYTARG